MELTDATPIGLIANEVRVSALKHAFPDGRAGHIHVCFERVGPSFTSVIEDDGVGMVSQPGEHVRHSGLSLVQALAEQLGATVRFEQNEGTRFILEKHPKLPGQRA